MSILSNDPSLTIPQLGWVEFRIQREGSASGPWQDMVDYRQRELRLERLRNLHPEDVDERLIRGIMRDLTGYEWRITEIPCDEAHKGSDAKWCLMHFMGWTKENLRLYMDLKLIEPIEFWKSGRMHFLHIPEPGGYDGQDSFLTDEYDTTKFETYANISRN